MNLSQFIFPTVSETKFLYHICILALLFLYSYTRVYPTLLEESTVCVCVCLLSPSFCGCGEFIESLLCIAYLELEIFPLWANAEIKHSRPTKRRKLFVPGELSFI